jgi:hypothetical protein
MSLRIAVIPWAIRAVQPIIAHPISCLRRSLPRSRRLVEADEAFDVVPRSDAFLGAQCGKIPSRLQLLERPLIEMENDQQVEQSVEGHLVTHIGELGRIGDRPVIAIAAADNIDQRDF